MTVVQLRELLRKRGLTVSGKKSELIKRLAYSAKAKRALVSPSATNEEIQVMRSARKPPSLKEPNHNASLVRNLPRKRPVSKTERDASSSKKLKLNHETISSSLRKGFPISSTTRSSKLVSTSSSTISSKRTPPSRVATRSSPRNMSSHSMNSSSSKRTPPSRVATKLSPRNMPSHSTNSSSSRPIRCSTRTRVLRKSPKVKPTNNRVVFHEATTKDKNLEDKVKVNPLSTITNSAKKRKRNRRASMNKSVNNALFQLEQMI